MLARRLSLSLLLPVLSLALPAPPGTKLYYVRNSAGQYLSPYHVEAGRSSAVFVQGTEAASQGYLNGTNQMFQVDSDLPWSMLLAPERYSEWAGAFLAADSATPGFSIEGSQLIWKNDQGQQGWLVCDWWHGLPQLFWTNNSENSTAFPSSCKKTELNIEYV